MEFLFYIFYTFFNEVYVKGDIMTTITLTEYERRTLLTSLQLLTNKLKELKSSESRIKAVGELKDKIKEA